MYVTDLWYPCSSKQTSCCTVPNRGLHGQLQTRGTTYHPTNMTMQLQLPLACTGNLLKQFNITRRCSGLVLITKIQQGNHNALHAAPIYHKPMQLRAATSPIALPEHPSHRHPAPIHLWHQPSSNTSCYCLLLLLLLSLPWSLSTTTSSQVHLSGDPSGGTGHCSSCSLMLLLSPCCASALLPSDPLVPLLLDCTFVGVSSSLVASKESNVRGPSLLGMTRRGRL